jgi:redox-sensing transcriptional repressor
LAYSSFDHVWRAEFSTAGAGAPRVQFCMSASPDKNDEPVDLQVPKAVVSRLSLYLRELQHLVRDGHETTSSSQLGSLLGFSDAQVRKDLAYFGHFGHPGIGYRSAELISAIRRILGTDRDWPVVIIGTGNLGRALLGYKGFSHQGFRIVAAFDVDPAKVGTTIEGVSVLHLNELTEVVQKNQIKLGLIAVPAATAQTVSDRLVAAGVEGIVNFAPVTLVLPAGVSLVGVDLAIELEQLSFSVVNRSTGD